MLKTRSHREFWILALIALVVLGAGLGLRDPWPADEPRFALAAKQMVESGNWLFPHRGIELYSDKPPLFMWLQALFYSLTGNLRIAFLLPPLLASLGTLWCVYDLGRRLWTPRVGLYAAYALLFAFQFTYQSKKAQIDPLVVFWITLANYGLLRHVLARGGGPDWRMWALGWAAAGLGTITKGVGFIALLMLIPAGIASLRGWPDVRVHAGRAKFWLGPLAFVAAACVWLVPMLIAALGQASPEYQAYLDDILFKQTAKRYGASWDHAHPPWYFLTVMITAWLPTILVVPWAVKPWLRRLRRRDARYLLPLAWWLLVLVFFSFPTGKRDMYILPALPMLCLALAPLLAGILRRPWPRRLALACTALLAVVITGLALAMWFGHPSFEERLTVDRGFTDGARGLAATLLPIGVWGFLCLLWFGRRRPVIALVSTLAGLWVVVGLFVQPLLNDSSSARGLMQSVGQRIGPRAELGLVAWKEQNLLMADRPATNFGFKMPWGEQLEQGITWLAQKPESRYLLVQEPALTHCVDRKRAEFAGMSNRRRWWLVTQAAWIPGCELTRVESQGQVEERDED
ncbi:ArnT family glycosyltransferase [Luteimonas panaciterrae]|uniref:ArnT family glycosyltransferase n=1 Tax=Luteimonas panaciterrae TaxID=363885 RepID=UPI001CFBA561|nr:glycosyltransferase family 39 protein [Luteimonas panaciterrae]